jgi:hypothetical protein
MPVLPHDISDLRLAPVILMVNARIEELSRLDLAELHRHVALVSDRADWNREVREAALLEAVRHTIDCHDWRLSWHPRGIQFSHGNHRVVLGVPTTFADYLAGKHRSSQDA